MRDDKYCLCIVVLCTNWSTPNCASMQSAKFPILFELTVTRESKSTNKLVVGNNHIQPNNYLQLSHWKLRIIRLYYRYNNSKNAECRGENFNNQYFNKKGVILSVTKCA